MAKNADFNLSGEIKKLLEDKANQELTGTEFLALLKSTHPKAHFKEDTAKTTWSSMRSKLGLGGNRSSGGKTTAQASGGVNDAAMFALRAGGLDEAKKAIEQLKENPAMAFAIASGGVDGATKVLEKLEKELAK